MNKIMAFTAFFMLFFLNINTAQDIKKGMIVQELTDVQSDDEMMAAQLGMMKGSTNTIHFNADKVLVSVDMMGGMMKMQTLTNQADKTGVMLMDMSIMGLKTAVDISDEDVEKSQENAGDINITYDKSDTKEILGYTCYKATITNPAMQGAEFTAYVTDEITIVADVIQGISGDQLKAFPLEYSIGGQGMKMVYTTIKIERDIDDAVFDLDMEGYDKMTMEEFQKQMSVLGGGGMGF